jgi:type II secretory pathway pseudopilin PulG
MVVLLIVMGIGAVWMTAALPAWKQQSTREKEADLVFRGRQYVRALRLYQIRNGPNTRPTSIDQLVDGKFLRKKYKDPITNDDFQPLYTSSAPTQPGQTAPGAQPAPAGQSSGVAGGQIIGVVSKSPAASIMLFNQASHYNEWQFVYAGNQQAPGGRPGGPGPGGGPGRGGVPTGPGFNSGGGVGPGPGRGGPPVGPGSNGRGGAPGPGRGRGGQ